MPDVSSSADDTQGTEPPWPDLPREPWIEAGKAGRWISDWSSIYYEEPYITKIRNDSSSTREDRGRAGSIEPC